VVLPIGR